MADERKTKRTASKGRLRRLLGIGRAGSADRDDSPQQAWRRVVRRRTFVVLTCLAIWATAVQARLGYLQVAQHEKYAASAEAQQQAVVDIEALRGDVLDRNGQMLAYSVKARSIFADPLLIEDPEQTVAAVCGALGDCSARERTELIARFRTGQRYYNIRRSRQVSPEQVERVVALGLDGIGIERDSGRYYPFGSIAAHILGFVGLDDTGQAGIEYAYDSMIRGENGLGRAQVDNLRRRLEMHVDRAPVPGATVELTIDLRLQFIVERALRDAVLGSRARAGTAIVTNPHTGEILALANYPTFDPNRISRSLPDERVNRATQHVYEPGSVFKIVLASMALQSGTIGRYDLIDTNPGSLRIPGRGKLITEYAGHRYGVLTFEDALVKSSNVAAVKIGLRAGKNLLINAVNSFGFGRVASRDFPGQSKGIWNPDRLDENGVASVSMGYQIAATPLQMVAAVGVVANGGRLIEPRIVRALVRDGHREVVTPNVVRQVVDKSTTVEVTGMMKNVVVRGTARAASIEGYAVAAKTGTSTRIAAGGGYSATDNNVSMAGFLPADDPQLALIVVIDSPRDGRTGGAVAGPAFRRISEEAMIRLGVAPSGGNQTPMSVRAGSADSPLVRRVSVTSQRPSVVRGGGPAVMPDLSGMSAREASGALAALGLTPVLSGAGFVEAQLPEAGSSIGAGGSAMVRLRRDSSLRDGDMP